MKNAHNAKHGERTVVSELQQEKKMGKYLNQAMHTRFWVQQTATHLQPGRYT